MGSSALAGSAFHRGRRRRRCSFEPLESRQLLDAAAVLTADSFSVLQNDDVRTLDVLANDPFSDEYTGLRQVTSVSLGSQGGRLRIAADHQFIHYAPPADFAGKETFTYQVDAEFSTQVTVEVVAPLADDWYEFVADGDPRELDLLANDPFVDGYSGGREITILSETSLGGEVTISSDRQSVLYTMPEGVFGKDTFLYIVDDRYPGRVTIDVPAPLTSDTGELIENDDATQFLVLANDRFWLGYDGPGKITHVLGGQDGSRSEIVDGGQAVTYRPATDFAGYDSIRYVVDGRFEASLQLTVHRPTRDDFAAVDGESREFAIPVAENDWYQTTGNHRRDIVNRVTSVGETAAGAIVTISADGQSVHYSPPAGFRGTDEFEYLADGTYRARVRVEVTDPVRDDWLTVYQHTVNNQLDVLANDFFGNGYSGPRVITKVSGADGALVLAPDGRSLTYTPATDARADQFEYEIDGVFSASARLHIGQIAEGDFFRFGQPAVQRLDVLANDHFSTNYLGAARVTHVSQPTRGGEVTIIDDGRALLYSGGTDLDQFGYTVDGQHEATVTIDYADRLRADDFTLDQNNSRKTLDVLANDFQSHSIQRTWGVYGGARRITAVTATEQGGTVEVADDGMSVSYTPAEDFHGNDRFTYVVDGFLETQVAVHVIRRVRDDQFYVGLDSRDNGLSVLVNDLFGADYEGSGTITAVTETAAGGTVSIEDNGQLLFYSPPTGFVGDDNFTYTVDGKLKAEVALVVATEGSDPFSQFETLAELREFLTADALARYENLFAADALFVEQDSLAGGAGFGRLHSETNVQVAGVDESDLIEIDGDFLYSLHSNSLVISNAWPAEELAVVSQTPIRGTPIGQFLSGDRLAVISREFELLPFDVDFDFQRGGIVDSVVTGPYGFAPYPQASSKTIVTILDLRDRTTPIVVQESEMDGNYVDSRRIGEMLFLVVENGSIALPTPHYECTDQGCTYETRTEYLARVESEFESIVAESLPHYSSFGPDGALVRTGLLVEPEEIYRPSDVNQSHLVSVASVSLANSEPGLSGATGIIAGGAAIIHGAVDSLYLFEQRFGWGEEETPSVEVLKFSWDPESGMVVPRAAGSVPGRMLDPFSADDFEGRLRIATTVSNSYSGNYSGRTENLLFVLEDDHGILKFVGGVKNLALDETIRSVRFFADRAIVVTFQTIDPLFGIDLSNPADPQVLGHVTLPGFAEYVQFVSPTRLLTVGRNTPNGFEGPVMISLLDVDDLAHPALIAQTTLPRFSRSEAAIDHHAFGWFAPHQVLAVPAVRNYRERVDNDGDGYRETSQWLAEHELYSFRVDTLAVDRDPTALDLLGKVEHSSAVRRSAFIDNVLYSIADTSIAATDINDPSVELAAVAIEVGDARPIRPLDESTRERLRRAQEMASIDFADRAGVEISSVLTVAAEVNAGGFRLVLRAGDSHHVYSTDGEDVTAELGGQVFAAAGRDVIWHNSENAYDVNNDGFIAPMDVAFIINDLNRLGSRPLPSEFVLRQISRPHFYFDVTNDGYTSASDVLQLINHLNRLTSTGEGEGEGGAHRLFPSGAAGLATEPVEPEFLHAGLISSPSESAVPRQFVAPGQSERNGQGDHEVSSRRSLLISDPDLLATVDEFFADEHLDLL